MSQNRGSKRGGDQVCSHRESNRAELHGGGGGSGQGTGAGQPASLVASPSTSALLECNSKYSLCFLDTTSPSATFLPSARIYILTLDFKIKTFIIKANSGIGSFNATPPRTDFEREKQP